MPGINDFFTELPRFVTNLNRIERDILGVDETEVDLSDLKY